MGSLKFGIMGMSEGNGHPYSWSAIFNGYNHEKMKECGFPVIPEYLSQQNFPADAIPDAVVSHIWTQDRHLSEKIASAALIENIVDDYTKMISEVDAILLARDDSVNHYTMAEPFLKSGIPVFIDKPLALSLDEAQRIFKLQQFEGQLFTCSSLRYAKELLLNENDKKKLGDVRNIVATVPKDWEKYSVHIIEPVIASIGVQGKIINSQIWHANETVTLNLLWESGVSASFSTYGASAVPITIKYVGLDGCATKTFEDTFAAFKGSLESFKRLVLSKKNPIPIEETVSIIEIIEAGIK